MFIGQWQCDWGVIHPRYANCQCCLHHGISIRYPKKPGCGIKEYLQFLHLLFLITSVCQNGQAIFCGLGVTPKFWLSLSWVWQDQLPPTHTTRPQKVGREKSGEYGYFPQDTVQFTKCMIGFFHTMLWPAHRSFRKVSQKLAEKASEGEAGTNHDGARNCRLTSWIIGLAGTKASEKKPKMCLFPEVRMQWNTT